MPVVPWSSDLLHWSRRAGGLLLRVAFWSMAALAALTLTAWLILQWGILPRLAHWKPELQAWASHSLGLEVRLGGLQVTGNAWAPVVTLHDLRLVDARGQEALRLARVEAVITPGSLLPRSPTRWLPHVQRLAFDALHLAVRRDVRGRVFLAGLPLERTDAVDGGGQVADWLFSQSEIRLHGASLSWQDEQRGAEPLVLTGVDLDLRNPLGRHVLHLSATPPQGWGSRFTVSAEMTHPLRTLLSMAGLQHPGDWRQWEGAVQADWPLVDVSQLRRHVDLPFDLLEGRGRLATRIDVAQGRLSGATADLQLQAVTLRVAKGLPPVALRRIAGQLEVRHGDQGSVVRAHQLSFQSQPPADATATTATPDPSAWPATDLELTLRGAPGAWTGGTFTASLVDLGLLAQSAAHVPLAEPVRRLLDATRPRGQVRQLACEWTGDVERPDHWRARGAADALQLAAAPVTAALTATATPGRPGLRGGHVRFDATDLGGQADLRIHAGELDFPGVFEQPRVALDHLQADVRWQLHRPRNAAPGTRPAIEVAVRHAVFANADGDGAFSGHWRSGPPGGPTFGRSGWLPGTLDLDATVHQLRADRIHRYLPLGLAASVRDYVRAAVLSGSAQNVRARVRGPVLDFPYPAPEQGEFALGGHFEGVTLDAVPGSAWPHWTDGAGQLVIDGQRLRLLQTRARLGQTGGGRFALEAIEGSIDNLGHDPVLHLRGHGHGPVTDTLHYLRTSPIDGWLDHAFAPAQGDGLARLALQLAVPLQRAGDTTVQGHVDLADTRLQMRPDTPALDHLQAQLDFTEHSFRLSQGVAQVAGGPLAFEGHLDDTGVLRFAGHGSATAQGLRTLDTVAPVARLAHAFDGQADYRLQLDLTPGGPTVQVDSDLTGLTSRLPAPLRKPAAQALPLRVRLAPQANPAHTGLQIDAGTAAAPVLHTRLLFEGDHGDRLLGGRVQVGAADGLPWPDSGLGVSVVLPRLSLDAWQGWLEQQSQPATAGADSGLAAVLRQVRLQVADLTLHGHRLTGVRAQLQQTGTPAAPVWSGAVETDQFAGQLTRRTGAVQVRLGRLALPLPIDPLAEAGVHRPASAEPLPALDVVVDDLVVGERHLGRLALQGGPAPAARLPTTATGEWHLQQFSLTRPEARLQAVGQWNPADPDTSAHAATDAGPGTSRLTFRLEVDDGGRWLDQLGWPGTLRGGRGQIGGQLHWPGPPTALALAQLGGAVRLDFAGGQWLQADPGGAGRLLGVLNLQSLTRRLSLDFRDLYQQGFSFDHLDGDVQIQRGQARTHNLRVRSVQAMVLAEGSTSLGSATQDVRVWVVPDLNAGAASLAYAVVNPVVGLGTLVTQWLLQRPLAEAATREFHITGHWDTPLVTPIDRTQDAHPLPRKDQMP
ncbi:YhdP family protein [Sphaerotilus sp.]|uniref:YhdP family protein n=1 Tax=Sphaerotilus sp. TaxID=2093942 RepID=UPI0025E819D3|nr:YhdP family protein [Sphaerotilus sp.]